MKRFFLSLLLCSHAFAITRVVSIDAPSQVSAGQSFVVPTSAQTDATDGEQIGFYHAEYSTNGGASWTGFCYDVNVGGYAARNAWITAGSAGSTIIVRVRIAFRGGAGDFDYAGNWIDWGGSWDNWQTPPTVYAYINVAAAPNQAPTIAWVQNPGSAYINQWFEVQARADDANGNLSNIWVWKDGIPFAFNGGGNGYQCYSDANVASRATAGSIEFHAQAADASGAYSSTIYHTVTINNRAPFVEISLTPATINFGQSTTFSSTITDADSNLYTHAILRWDGSNWRRPTGTNYPRMGWNVYTEDTVGWSSVNPSNDYATGSSDTKSGVYRPQSVTSSIYFHANGSDGYTYASNWVSQQLVVNKATPAATFASRTIAPTASSYAVNAADLNATFSNPYSSLVALPTGAVTYSFAATGAPVAVGTVLNIGSTYTIRASYAGDSNYNATTVDATWTISDANLDSDNDGMPNWWEQENFQPTGNANPNDDGDGDGLTNVAEYNLRTNPKVYDQGTSTLGSAIPAGWPNGGANPAVPVGATSGSLQIDKNGAATYSVPLWVTPGTAGMQPQLSLNYSSQAGAGSLGFGWSLSGVSAITRGPQTLAIDNQIKGITYTSTDRFYMDGQRLIYVGGGSGYGTDGAEYRTEIDSISKIVSYGSVIGGTGPTHFKVWTKAGLILEFGNSGNNSAAAAEAQGRSEIATWAVSRISDTKGNYMTFDYAEDTVNGEQRLTRINYTGNGSVAPYASVRLTYEPRADTFSGYVAGSKVSRTQRIKRIGSYYGETLAREYTLQYDERANTGRSILTEIREKGSDGAEYAPLTFSYEAPAAGWAGTLPTGVDWGAPSAIAQKDAPPRGTGFVDLNGDGRPDFVKYHRAGSTNSTGAWLNDPVSGWGWAPQFIPPDPLAEDNISDTGSRFVDIDGDGFTEFVRNGYVYFHTGSGWSLSSNWSFNSIPHGTSGDAWWTIQQRGGFFLDLNGDGRPDFLGVAAFYYLEPVEDRITFGGKQIIACLNTGSGFVRADDYALYFNSIWTTVNGSGLTVLTDENCLQTGARFLDLNGDGLPDFIQSYYNSGWVRRVALNNGQGFFGEATNSPYQAPHIFNANNPTAGVNAPVGTEAVDVNGDGLVDLVWRNDAAGNYYHGVAINTGKGWELQSGTSSPFYPGIPLSHDHSPTGAAILDINGDGLPDIVKGWEAWDRDTRLGTGRGWSGTVSAHNVPRQISQGGLPNTGTDYVDLNADGLVDQIWHLEWNGATKGAAINASRGSDRLISATNAFNVTASITYAPLTERDSAGSYTVYTKGAGGPVGSINVIGPTYVVKSVTHDDGIGGQYALTYRYGGLRSDRLRGSLGFEWMQVTDSRTSITTNTSFKQEYPFIGMPWDTKTRTGTGVFLSETTVTYAEVPGMAAGTRLPYAATTVETTRELDNSVIVTTTTSITGMDTYGNVTGMTVSTSDGFAKATTNFYNADNPTNWFLGRLTGSIVSSTGPAGYDAISRNSSFTYNSAGLLESETVAPGDATLALTTTYGYDQFGNKTSVTVSGASVTVSNTNGDLSASATVSVSRATSAVYDSQGRFPVSTTNALGHTENYTGYNQVLGVLTSMTGANGLPTSWQYDGFGRKTKETRADGTVTDTRYKWAAVGSPAGALYLVETESTGAPPALAFHDKFGRPIQGLSISGDGRIVYQTTSYDPLGRTKAKSNPYVSQSGAVPDPDAPTNEVIHWTKTTEFDLLNRPKTVTTPDDQNGTQTSTYTYAGLSSTAIDPKNRTARTVKNSQGWTLVNVRNEVVNGTQTDQNSIVSYGYDAVGNLVSTTAQGSTTSLFYDNRGRKTSMIDPSMGTWHYRYNIFGELIWQKDPKGQIVTMEYDDLGRMTSRAEAEGTTTWTYDTAAKSGGGTWKGKLASVSAPGGYSESYTYDAKGRPQKISRTIDGTAYEFETGYDSVGRPVRTKYPVSLAGVEAFSTRAVYNQFGYLKEIRNWVDGDGTADANGIISTIANPSGVIHWQAETYSVLGRIDGESYGNGLRNYRDYSDATGRLLWARIDRGALFDANPLPTSYAVQQLDYTYDAVGNVTRRNEQTPGFVRDERFEDYDGLDRLRSSRVEGIAGSTVTVTYAANGNILTKSDVGSYNYNATVAGRSLPHAVGTAGVNAYTYDAVGNMLTGANRDFAWTSYNQMRWVKSGGLSSEFFFGAGHERVKQVRRSGTTVAGGNLSGTVTDTTIYVGALYEKVTTAATNTIEHKHYIVAPSGRIGVVTRSTINGLVQANTTRYFHNDGLGSLTVVSDEAGRVLKRYGYDGWGKQNTRYTNTTPGIVNQAPTTRGFTDHEMLSDHGLVHMNGRVYDPVLGRFLSADPNVDGEDDAQGFNRYSYVGNNPMNATDPSGYFKLKEILPAIIGIIVAAIVIVALTPASGGFFATLKAGLGTKAAIWGGAAGGFASGFSGSLLNGGSIGDAFKAGVIGAAVGAATAWAAQGIGDFFDDLGGAWADGTFNNWAGRTLAHATVGGAASSAQGGQFRHGFYSSAASAGFMHSRLGGRLMRNSHIAVRTATAAAIGGTASALGGGKFANGAVTSAFQHLFNRETTEDDEGKKIAAARQRIADAAERNVGSRAWMVGWFRKGYGPLDFKCNLFVAEMVEEGLGIGGRLIDAKGNAPLAGTWGDPSAKIEGWKVVTDSPQPGDVIAIRALSANATGHVGIVVAKALTVSQASPDHGNKVIRNDWGFRAGQEKDRVVRRYYGKSD